MSRPVGTQQHVPITVEW